MIAHGRRFFKHHHTEVQLMLLGKLHQSAGSGKAGRAGANDNNVDLHGFSFDWGGGLCHDNPSV